MALRLLAVLSLVCLTLAQDSSIMPSATTDAITMPTTTMEAAPMATPMATPMSTPMATPMPTDAPTTPPAVTDGDRPLTQPAGSSSQALIDQANMNLDISERYYFADANATRDDHFFCEPQGGVFPRDDVDAASQPIRRVWTIMLQYPVLAYLDSIHKTELVSRIVEILNLGGLTIANENFCIGYVFHYDVSLYTESVLFQVYTRNLDPVPTPDELNNAFQMGRTNPNAPIVTFLGRQAIMLNETTHGTVNMNVHPGAFRPGGARFDPEDDPTLRAVILGNWPRGYSLEDIMTNPSINASVTSNFAVNPNPVFYGLTAGDIVFAVIATTLCAILAFLMVFGFCIQPFLM